MLKLILNFKIYKLNFLNLYKWLQMNYFKIKINCEKETVYNFNSGVALRILDFSLSKCNDLFEIHEKDNAFAL